METNENNDFAYDKPNEASPINIDNLTIDQRTKIDKILAENPQLSYGEAARQVLAKTEGDGQVE